MLRVKAICPSDLTRTASRHRDRWRALYAAIAPTLIAFRSVLRGVPLLLSGGPKTPLRLLCIMAFDMQCSLRTGQPIPFAKLKTLAALLDIAACANAVFDNKPCCQNEYRIAQRRLEKTGMRSSVAGYLLRLCELENNRPLPRGNSNQFQRVVLYRESVVRLSLAIVAKIATDGQSLDDEIHRTYSDPRLNLLFRIAMQFQIVDDVLDYSKDMAAGLPSFLTAVQSFNEASTLTQLESRAYADMHGQPKSPDTFPLRVALHLVSTLAGSILSFGDRSRRRIP